MRVAINLLTENPEDPSGAHWCWTRVFLRWPSGLTTVRSYTCW